jgi:chromate transporter
VERHQKPGLTSLFLNFLKIGSTAFGGFMALISIVQKELVEKRQLSSDQDILDGVSLATVLPGPIAVNLIAFVGYRLRGFKGGLISMLAVILPSFFLILGLSIVYFKYGNVVAFQKFFDGVLPAVAAIILAVAINMTRKNIKNYKQYILAVIAFILVVYVGGFYITLLLVVSGGLIGFILFRKSTSMEEDIHPFSRVDFFTRVKAGIRESWKWLIILFVIIFFLFVISLLPENLLPERIYELNRLFLTLSMVSVTLFGGGYVFIPMLQELVVTNLGWLTNQEFIDGIAMGQITPGPIMISATFIGYKVAGIPGAILATIAMFLPPGILIMICSGFINYFKNSPALKAIFKGIHPVVIGMIFAACLIIILSMPHEWSQFIIFVLSFVLTFWFKVDLLIIIPLSGLAGILFGSI